MSEERQVQFEVFPVKVMAAIIQDREEAKFVLDHYFKVIGDAEIDGGKSIECGVFDNSTPALRLPDGRMAVFRWSDLADAAMAASAMRMHDFIIEVKVWPDAAMNKEPTSEAEMRAKVAAAEALPWQHLMTVRAARSKDANAAARARLKELGQAVAMFRTRLEEA